MAALAVNNSPGLLWVVSLYMCVCVFVLAGEVGGGGGGSGTFCSSIPDI